MLTLNRDHIRKQVADSMAIFHRGLQLYEYGAFCCTDSNPDEGFFSYTVDGNYGDYTTEVRMSNGQMAYSCDCPYPGQGCKHTVAILFDVADRLNRWKDTRVDKPQQSAALDEEKLLTADEIREQALDDRKKRAQKEDFTLFLGDMLKGEHVLQKADGRQYTVTLHDPAKRSGHCSCPDFLSNRLDTCKHIIHLANHLQKTKGFTKRLAKEHFPFVDIFWDATVGLPKLFSERPAVETEELRKTLNRYFDEEGLFTRQELARFPAMLAELGEHKQVRVRESVLAKVDRVLTTQAIAVLSSQSPPSLSAIKATLYPYQEEGVNFALFRQAALIGDEMGLGKTLQAIAAAILKKEIFGFEKVLVVTLASLKDQWQREIRRFTGEEATVVAGSFKDRRTIYQRDTALFKITNYEAVLRDVGTIAAFKPDLVILDEAQRIKNFETKTANAIKALPRKHALVLTGTPLENKLEDVYSIVQFLDPDMLSPLWRFAADHFMLSREKKGKIMGYHNLEKLHAKLKSIVIRRRKKEVLSELPDEVTNNYYIDLNERQAKIHAGYAQSLMPLLHKKFLTPMDLRRIQELLLLMRRVCDSTYLIDRKTNISPKLKELESILDELVIQNDHKVVIFSEWTAMTFLIGKHLSEASIPFVELSGKIPVHKRQALIDEFTNNPQCKVFLSTDAGGTGLNLQAADCVINFELPGNPARLHQRIGRVSRIGQKSKCVNVVNLIAKHSIEERILAGIQLKTDLFKGVFDGEGDVVEFSREKRTEMLNRLREMMGEEPMPVVREPGMTEEIPEDTPHYLNPEVLAENDTTDFTGEEVDPAESLAIVEEPVQSTESVTTRETETSTAQSPEKMEAVLNQGMAFISGLLEMATGKKIETVDDDDRLIQLDKETGEVTMKFKLPGF
jgi:superfamily II DNA or RNA helicase